MMKILSHNFTGNSLVVVSTNGAGIQTRIIENSHPNWNQVMVLYKAGLYEQMVPMFDMGNAIAAKFHNNFTVVGTDVMYKGNVVRGYLVDRIVFFMRELPNQAERLERFAENLYLNPSPYVIEQLYKFLEHKNMPITDDGCFLAYKGVGADYYSHTAGNLKIVNGKVKDGRVYNGIGEVITAERPDVCDDKNQGCARGLHVGSWEYANNFKGDGNLMVVKVNPKNAVQVPDDCSWSKLRACEYEVIAEEGRQLHEVRDSNFDKVVEARKKFNRDSLGRFSAYCRDSLGRFAPKQ
jgi:hypothetical protein